MTRIDSTGLSEPTIFAVSTAPGRAGVAVVRVSGRKAGSALSALTGRAVPPPRHASLARLRDPADGTILDEALCLWFPGPASFTGEDVAELHVHGGRAVVSAVLTALGSVPGLIPAEPGAFTRRAVANGKMDLTQAEGLIDLIDAETDAQRRQALRQSDGMLRRLYDGWHESLVRALAYAEAEIDFPDEGDVPDALITSLRPIVSDVCEQMAGHLADGHRGERLRDGLSAVLVGPPNVGKSTLLNALARRDVAIVSDEAGTTRDVLEVSLDLGGFPVVLVDTAGLRMATGAIEQEGMRRARVRADSADLRIAVVDGRDPEVGRESLALLRPGDFVLANKADLGDDAAPAMAGDPNVSAIQRHAVSAKTGLGLDRFLAAFEQAIAERWVASDVPVMTRLRHREAVTKAYDALQRSIEASDREPELVAEDLRLAMRHLGMITGRVDVDDLLDVVFRDFCIGK